MKRKNWKDIAELVGTLAIVASLIFVGLQLEQSQNIANADRLTARAANWIELHSLLADHGEVWSRGLAGSELTDSEALVFEHLMRAYGSFYMNSANSAQSLGDGATAAYIARSFAGFLHKNPGARQNWSDGQAIFRETMNKTRAVRWDEDESWRSVVAESLERLDAQAE